MIEKEADTEETKESDTWWCTGSVKKCTCDAFSQFSNDTQLGSFVVDGVHFVNWMCTNLLVRAHTFCTCKNICMHVCKHTHTCPCACVCVCVCAQAHVHTDTHVACLFVCTHMCVHANTCISMNRHAKTHTHTCVCVLLSNVLNFLPTCKNACHWEMGCKSWACNDCLGGFVDCLSVYFEKWISEFLINVLIQLLAGWKANLSKCTNRTMQMPRTAPKMPRSTGKLNILHD